VSEPGPTLDGVGRLVEPEGGGAALPGSQPRSEPAPLRIALEDDSFSLELAGGRLRRAAYRDLAVIAAQPGSALLVLGSGPAAPRLVCEQFGSHLGLLVRELRDRRLRQRLADRFVEIPQGEPIELVEFEALSSSGLPAETAVLGPAAPPIAPPDARAPGATGVGQLAYHAGGFVIAPLDERDTWLVVPRSHVGTVTLHADIGEVVVDTARGVSVRLLRLGAAAIRHCQRMDALRRAALADASALVEALIPDAPFDARDRASALLVDGRPADPATLGAAWAPLEAAVLTVPTFAESYGALVQAAGGDEALRWLSVAPESPGSDVPRSWFTVALPGNLVAMELVSEGAHATYCLRAVPRASYAGEAPASMRPALEQAVASLSEALLDIRFLREPIGLPEAALRAPAYTRYRLAIAALPSLAAARTAFVARLVHDAGWAAALGDLMRWHSACRDDAAEWAGRAAQEATIMGLAKAGATAPAATPG